GMMYGGRHIAAGILVMVFGSLGTWLWALLLRAFGDMADDTRAIRERLEAPAPAAVQAEMPVAAAPKAPGQPRARKPAPPKTDTPEIPDVSSSSDT
ncbi:MAG: hypothetical protein IH607_08405, partial [Firmicutes bacterium]|nr:hypothetical protein [Bacillota bacterium]